MRDISNTLEDAILNKKSSSALVRATISSSRTFFKSLEYAAATTYDENVDGYDIPTDTPVGQCVVYSPNKDTVYTFIVDPTSGIIYGMAEGSAMKNNLGITANVNTKPSALDMGDGTARLYYWNSGLYYVVVNLSTWGTDTPVSVPINMPFTPIVGSPTVLNKTQLVLCYTTTLGGIGVAFMQDQYTWKHWEQRFMSPKSLTQDAWTIYTSAVVFEGKVYVYSTDLDQGYVRAVEYSAPRDAWSDIHIALPADLSRFDISNAVVANGYVHLAGRYHRTEDYSEAKVYSLVLRSPNGKNFSWDRFTLLSTLGYHFHVAIDNTNKKVYASDRNAIGKASMSYYFTSIPTTQIILEPPNSIVSFSTSSDSGTMSVSAANEEYLSSELIKKGNRVIVDVGYKTDAGIEYMLYGTYIIDSLRKSWADGNRSLTLNLVNEGLWKTNQIAFPFYAEILSKSSQFDNCEKQNKMYVVPTYSGSHINWLTIDFWNDREWDGDDVVTSGQGWSFYEEFRGSDESLQATFGSGASDQLRAKTVELNAHPLMSTYPTITGTFDARIYGTENPNISGRPCSTITLYAITAPETDLSDKTVTAGVLTSAYSKYPRDYPSAQAGSYPVTYQFTGIEVGHKLLYFGITMSNSVGGWSQIWMERIEVEGLKFGYDCYTSKSPWVLETPPGDTRKGLKSPETGLPNIMFTTKPYSAFNFNISSEFIYSAGEAPLSPGTTAWGVLGLAKDGFDYILARYKRQTSRIELCLFRSGELTILDTYSISSVHKIMLDHRNGLFRVWYKVTDTWVGPVISHSYNEVSHGPLSTSDTGIMHTGIYGCVEPPSFIAAGFGQPYSDGITITTHQDKSVLDGFLNSGYVLINRTKYKYGLKSTNINGSNVRYGPNQLRQVSDIGTWEEGGVTFHGVGVETSLYKPTNPIYLAKNLLLGMSNYHNWLISKSDWTVTHSTAGSPDYLRNRSKHYSAHSKTERGIGATILDKCYINHGLLDISLAGEDPKRHRDCSLCSLWSTDRIWVRKVVSTEINHDATVQDITEYLCYVASIKAEYPGNWIESEVAVSSTPVELAVGEEIFPGGSDIRFILPGLQSEEAVFIHITNLDLPEISESVKFGFENSGGALYTYVESSGGTQKERIRTERSPLIEHDIRVLVHEDFVTFYADSITLATFALGVDNLEWPEEKLIVKASASTPKTIKDIVISELFDWREAIYIESELSVSSAIGSVIQERPIEIYALREGGLSFSYRFERDEVNYSVENAHNILIRHDTTEQNSSNAGSDALVYYADITFAYYENYAIEDGFNTRVFSLASLDTGAKLAARLLLEKAFEKQSMHGIAIRPDLRLDIGDIVDMEYILSGTGSSGQARGIVEDINVGFEEGKHYMNVTLRGRKAMEIV